uniref:Uncharacterized protein n=1 Tax=viral metagenome TaxID=1070528 RepID=A0A6C0ANZ6_9ZZZZ
MSWVSGLRSNIIYTIAKRPLDPRWSQQDLQIFLGHCANGQALGWEESRAVNTAEALVIRTKNHGIYWSNSELNKDMDKLLSITWKQHEAQ